MSLVVPPRIEAKIRDEHGVAVSEVEQCFVNIEGDFLIETRPEHQAESGITMWFVASTNQGRRLKIVFVLDGGNRYLASAYNANATWEQRFEQGQQ